MADQPKPPLWRVMHETAARAFTGDLNHPHAERIITAAEIRALADWLVPELDEPDWGACAEMRCDIELYEQHMQFRKRLLAEAERAEAGDG